MHVSYSFIYCHEQSNIMLAFPSIPCWDSSMIWWGGKAVKEIEGQKCDGSTSILFCAVPKYSVLPTVADAALSHLTLSYYIMRCIASTSINGSRLTHCRSILDSVTSKPYHILPYTGIGRIILWLPSLPHHVETEVWFDGEGKAVKEIEVEPKYSVPTIVADVGLLHSTPSY